MSTPPLTTWMCTFICKVDFPATASITSMEGAVAYALAAYLQAQGLPGNAAVQLVATAGNVTVANPTTPVSIGSNPTLTQPALPGAHA